MSIWPKDNKENAGQAPEPGAAPAQEAKSLGNTDINGTSVNVPDVVVFGDGDMWKLLCKASSQRQGWMKSSKALEIAGIGCMVQVTTQQRNPDGSYAVAEAVSFVPDVMIEEIWPVGTKQQPSTITGRKLVPIPGRLYEEPAAETADTAAKKEKTEK